MNSTDYLDHVKMKTLCDTAKQKLFSDNENYTAVINVIQEFIDDDSLEGEAYTQSKLLLLDFIQLFSCLILLNEEEMDSFLTFKSFIPDRDYYGTDIFERRANAQYWHQFYSNLADNCLSAYNNCPDNIPCLKMSFYSDYCIASELRSIYERKIQITYEEENEFDTLNLNTAGMFDSFSSIRTSLRNALEQIRGAIDNRTNINSAHLFQLLSNTLHHITNQISEVNITPDQNALDEIAARHRFSEDEMEYLCDFHPGLINQLYRMDILGTGRSELVLRIIHRYLDNYHNNAYICNGYTVPEEYILLIAELENNASTLSYCGYFEGSDLVGIYPHYVQGDSGITFGYGHYVSNVEYNGNDEHDPDPSEIELVNQYVPVPSFFYHEESSVVPGSSYMSIEECNHLLGEDFSEHFEVVVDWLEDEDIHLSMSQIIALTIYRFREGNIMPLEPYISDYYYTGTYDADTWNYLWLGQNPENNPAPQNRIDAYNNLFFGT